MGVWSEQVVPRLVDVLEPPAVTQARQRVCAGLSGRVLEIGSGSGKNLPHLPAGVTEVVAVEPSAAARRLAGPRVRQCRVHVSFQGEDAARLPLPDGSVDAALSTLVLCTVPDVEAALREVLRVLRPGGALHLVEHGLAPDDPVARWQHRLDPLQQRLFAGCHLTRNVAALLAAAGFDVAGLERGYLPGPAPARPWGFVVQGRARKPA